MKIFLMLDNWVGWQVAQHLKSLNENIVGIALHPKERQHYATKILESLNLPEELVFEVGKNIDDEMIRTIKELSPDVILVVFWAYLLPQPLIAIPSNGCINFHCSLLPYNRGKNPNVWPIVEGTPAGITLHYIDEGIDTGDIIAQQEIPIEIIDTAETLYKKMIGSFVELFNKTWPTIKTGDIHRSSQNHSTS